MSGAQSEARIREKKLNRIAYVLSAVVLLLVVMMRKYKIPTDIDFSFLPPIHAGINFLCFIALLFALWFIKKRDVVNHRRMIYVALGLSALFLLSYVTYHFTTEETRFCQEGSIRIVYFLLLISHIILAGGILPFILIAFNRAITEQYDRHKKMVRWVYPLWLYVTMSGPICYLMLKPCYGI